MALVVRDEVFVANAGDSMCYAGLLDGSSLRLSDAHNTDNVQEILRCEAAGAIVEDRNNAASGGGGGGCCCCCCCCYGGGSQKPKAKRVYPGGVNVTRAFGDFHAKRSEFGGLDGAVIPDCGPVRRFKLVGASWLVLASDGLWDALPPDVIFKSLARTNGQRGEDSAEQLAGNLQLVGNPVRDLEVGGHHGHNAAERLTRLARKSSHWVHVGAPVDNISIIALQIIIGGV